jgi:tRNA pseudouridine38-40 synthase
LNVDSMDVAAQLLVGRHDFSAFVAATATGDRAREIFRAGCWRDRHLVTIDLEGSGFLRQMVRSIAGTLVRVGTDGLTADDLSLILAGRDRSAAGVTAPAHGLYLAGVEYGTPLTKAPDHNDATGPI